MIYFNGVPVKTPKNITLAALLKRMGRDASQTVVLVDGRFVPPAEYKSFVASDGACVEARQLLDGG